MTVAGSGEPRTTGPRMPRDYFSVLGVDETCGDASGDVVTIKPCWKYVCTACTTSSTVTADIRLSYPRS